MIENAEQKINNVEFPIAEQEKELVALEGERMDKGHSASTAEMLDFFLAGIF